MDKNTNRDQERLTEEEEIIIIPLEEIVKPKVAELRNELKKRGLSIKGKKSKLVEALSKAMVDRVPIQKERTEEQAQATVFRNGVKWKKMNPSHTVVDPTSSSHLRAPTVPNNEATTQYKYDFENVFD